MNQITVFSRINALILIPLILLNASIAQPPDEVSSDSANILPIKEKTVEKDEVLTELQFSAQGIFTDSNTEKTAPTESNIKKPIAADIPSEDAVTADSTKFDTDKEISTETDVNTEDSVPTENTVISHIKENKDSIDTDLTDIRKQRQQEYDPSPSRMKKEELAEKLRKVISANPKNETAYWELFELHHHYIEWSQDTEFYQEDQKFQALELLQDMYKKFGENQTIMKYLCQYLIINDLYVESQPYCQKAKKLLPNDTDLHIFADYFFNSTHNELKTKKRKTNKFQILLNILKTKPPSEKLFTTIGVMFADKKKYKLSMKYFKRAIKLNDSYIPGLLGLARVLIKLDQPETALEYYILSCQKHPYKTRTPFQQAKAYLSQKSLFKLASEYQSQINVCINSIKISH